MKPGATISPVASMTRFAAERGSGVRDSAVIRSPTIPTSARKRGALLPSMTVPPVRIRSNVGDCAEVADANATSRVAERRDRIRRIYFAARRNEKRPRAMDPLAAVLDSSCWPVLLLGQRQPGDESFGVVREAEAVHTVGGLELTGADDSGLVVRRDDGAV